jgi:hypothetical protein
LAIAVVCCGVRWNVNVCSCASNSRNVYLWMSLDEWLERLTANAVVATVLGSISASSNSVESEGRQTKQC